MSLIKRVVKRTAKPIIRKAKIFINYYDDPIVRQWFLKHAERLKKFKNIHSGESCFIMGNGPSLNKIDLNLLKGCYNFGLNKIYLIFDKANLDLSYHVAVNRLVIEQSISEFRALPCPSFLSYRAAHNLINTNDNQIYFIATGGPYTFSRDITSPIREGYTVTYVALQIAYYMGFQNVYLIGVDHTFIADGKANEKQFMEGDDPNHFDNRYFKNNDWQLPDLEASELSYHLARYFYSKAGRNVYDATVDGKLNVFPKISYEEALYRVEKQR